MRPQRYLVRRSAAKRGSIDSSDDHDTVRKEVHHRVMEVSGVPPHEVLLVAPGSLPKTSSGKLQRSLCRDRYHENELEPVS